MAKATKKNTPRIKKPKKVKRLTRNQQIKLLTAEILGWCRVEKTRSKRWIYTSHNNSEKAKNSEAVTKLMEQYDFGLQYTL